MKSFYQLAAAVVVLASTVYAADTTLEHVKDAKVATDHMGQHVSDMAHIKPGLPGLELTRKIIVLLQKQTSSFIAAKNAMPESPSAAQCHGIYSAFDQYVQAYTGLTPAFAAMSNNDVFATEGHGFGGSKSHLAKEVATTIEELGATGAGIISRTPIAPGFQAALNGACKNPASAAVHEALKIASGVLATALRADFASFA